MLNEIKKEFLDRVRANLGDEKYQLYLESFEKPETHGMTVNLKKLGKSSIDLDFLINKFNAKLIYRNDNYAYLQYDKNELFERGISLGKDPLHHAGLFYIQEPSAFSVINSIEIRSSDVVLDLCASPGGKSIETLYSLDKELGGFLVSNEIDFKRSKILLSNIERMGFDNVAITCNAASELANNFVEYFDKVIVDAPCSGEGMFRKSKEARDQWSEVLVKSCAKTQKELLDFAYKMLKNGGEIIYSTCTFSIEEDEENINYVVDKYGDLKLIKMDKMWPFNSLGEGQFFAIIKKGNDEIIPRNCTPQIIDFKVLNLIRYGIDKYTKVGKEKMPTHASSHSDFVSFDNVVDLDDDKINNYLKGEVIRMELPFKGYCKVTYKNMGIGIAKYSNGMLKNHYPKGLRNL